MNFFDKNAQTSICYGNLPHWRQESTCYFVTFREGDSIPQIKLNEWLRNRNEWLVDNPEPRTEDQINEYHKLFTRKMEEWLNSNYGQCMLANGKCKAIVESALEFYHNQRYRLLEYTIAANHVHLLIEPLYKYQLPKIMHSIKSYTAKEINKAYGRSGHFWQKEYFDHIVRNEVQYDRFVKYIRDHELIVEMASRRLKETTRQDDVSTVEMASRRLKDNTRQDDVSTVETASRRLKETIRQDDVSTIKRQDDVSTIKRQDDVSTDEVSTTGSNHAF